MKNAMILFTLMMSMSTLVAAHLPDAACREFVAQGQYASEKARMAADLTGGIWQLQTQRLGGAEGQMIFHDFGMADEIITHADGKMSYDRLHWTVEEYNGAVFLVVTQTSEKNRTNLYRMTPTCEGMDLTDAASLERIRLVHRGGKVKAVAHMAQYLSGAWVVTDYPFDIAREMEDCGTFEPIRGAFLQYAFRANGTFVREWGNAGITYREQGFWDVTADGDHLLFHVAAADGQTIIRTDVALIEDMGNGDFRIRQALETGNNADQYCTRVKSFGFRRWAPKS
jgi:hypothetical protein